MYILLYDSVPLVFDDTSLPPVLIKAEAHVFICQISTGNCLYGCPVCSLKPGFKLGQSDDQTVLAFGFVQVEQIW